MTAEEARRFLVAVQAVCEEEIAQAEGDAADGQRRLRDALLDRLDVSAFAAADEVGGDAGVLRDAMVVFCFRWCAYARDAGMAGDHAVCGRCPLAPYTVQRYDRGVEEALR